MKLNFNIVSLIETLGLVQGVILGFLLIFINKRKEKATIFLGLFIICYSIDFISFIVVDLKITDYYPRLKYLPFDFIFILFPLFYVYIQKVSILSNEKMRYWPLYPGIVHMVFQITVFLLPMAIIQKVYNPTVVFINRFVGMAYFIFIATLIIMWINRHIKEVGNQYTNIKFRELRWARTFVIIGLIYSVFAVSFFSFYKSFNVRICTASLNVILLYWISIRGIMQRNVNSVYASALVIAEMPDNEIFEKDQEGDNEAISELATQIATYINDSQIFTKPDLTIIDVAEALNTHPRKISTAINTISRQNFNTYINEYRISKAKDLLKSPLVESLTTEAIGSEVGFQSKSAFYAAFKKITGTTPTQFKNRN